MENMSDKVGENVILNIHDKLDNVKETLKKTIHKLGVKMKKEETHLFTSKFKENINPVRKIDGEYNVIITKYELQEKYLLEEFMKKNLFTFQDDGLIQQTDNLKTSNLETKQTHIQITTETIELTYDNFSYSDVLKQIIPKDFDQIPNSYEIIGKIAHLNLREKFLEYKYLIGQIILDKNPSIKTVINKTSKIDNLFRTYEMEVLAGVADFEVQHKEVSCLFTFDIRKVYWCSRLQHERDRILKKFKKGEVLCDAFCGVGPLSIRAAKMGIKVLANDLNPSCYEYLNLNIEKNKIKTELITTFNMDAREFIRTCVDQGKNFPDEEKNFDGRFPNDLKIDHIYMNLPKDAIEFLDVFRGLFNNTKKSIYSKNNLPYVHVYGFSNAKDPKEDLYGRIASAFGIEKFEDKLVEDFYNVRDVSTKKHVFCISFRVPFEVAYQ